MTPREVVLREIANAERRLAEERKLPTLQSTLNVAEWGRTLIVCHNILRSIDALADREGSDVVQDAP